MVFLVGGLAGGCSLMQTYQADKTSPLHCAVLINVTDIIGAVWHTVQLGQHAFRGTSIVIMITRVRKWTNITFTVFLSLCRGSGRAEQLLKVDWAKENLDKNRRESTKWKIKKVCALGFRKELVSHSSCFVNCNRLQLYFLPLAYFCTTCDIAKKPLKWLCSKAKEVSKNRYKSGR